MKKHLYFSLGWLFFAIGILAAFIPVIPTTPFMILALWAFSKSSKRFHHWLYHHRIFGPALQKWDQYQVIPLVAKIFAISAMLISLLYLIFYSGVNHWIILSAAIFMTVAAVYILSKPSNVPQQEKEQESVKNSTAEKD